MLPGQMHQSKKPRLLHQKLSNILQTNLESHSELLIYPCRQSHKKQETFAKSLNHHSQPLQSPIQSCDALLQNIMFRQVHPKRYSLLLQGHRAIFLMNNLHELLPCWQISIFHLNCDNYPASASDRTYAIYLSHHCQHSTYIECWRPSMRDYSF